MPLSTSANNPIQNKQNLDRRKALALAALSFPSLIGCEQKKINVQSQAEQKTSRLPALSLNQKSAAVFAPGHRGSIGKIIFNSTAVDIEIVDTLRIFKLPLALRQDQQTIFDKSNELNVLLKKYCSDKSVDFFSDSSNKSFSLRNSSQDTGLVIKLCISERKQLMGQSFWESQQEAIDSLYQQGIIEGVYRAVQIIDKSLTYGPGLAILGNQFKLKFKSSPTIAELESVIAKSSLKISAEKDKKSFILEPVNRPTDPLKMIDLVNKIRKNALVEENTTEFSLYDYQGKLLNGIS